MWPFFFNKPEARTNLIIQCFPEILSQISPECWERQNKNLFMKVKKSKTHWFLRYWHLKSWVRRSAFSYLCISLIKKQVTHLISWKKEKSSLLYLLEMSAPTSMQVLNVFRVDCRTGSKTRGDVKITNDFKPLVSMSRKLRSWGRFLQSGEVCRCISETPLMKFSSETFRSFLSGFYSS